MTTLSAPAITQWLVAWSDGNQAALERLVPLVEAELHRLARGYLRHERPGHLLQTSALVNEAYLRLIGWRNVRWQNRAHFFAVSATLMRRILVDFARRLPRRKGGGHQRLVSLEEVPELAEGRGANLVDLDQALQRLASLDPRKARVVELRFFGGLSVKDTADALHVSPITVMRQWSRAKAWLYLELANGDAHEA